jgi:hypothetical protein
MFKKIKDYLLARLKEKTTWGIILTGIATVFGVQIAPEISEQITIAGMALASLIGAASTEQPK